MASILRRLGQLFSRKPQETAAEERPTKGYHGPSPLGPLRLPWVRHYDRKRLEEDLNEMDETDDFVARGLDVIADCALAWSGEWPPIGFKIGLVTKPGEEPTRQHKDALDVLNDLVERTDINGLWAWQLVRDMAKKGNVFTELVFDDDDHIARVVQFQHSYQIEKNVDDSARLKTGDPTRAARDPKAAAEAAYVQRGDGGQVLSAFFPYQIVHWQFGRGGGKVYCDPMLAPSIRGWSRTRAQEDSLAVARITRAFDTNLHKVAVPIGAKEHEIEAKLDQYKGFLEQDVYRPYDVSTQGFVSTPRRTPMDVVRDWYVVSYYTEDGRTVGGEVERLQPSTAALENINDIYWGITRLLTGLGVPMDYLSLKVGNRAFIDKGEEKTLEAFDRMLKRLQMCHAVGLKFLFDMELLLSGIDPRNQAWVVRYPGIMPQSAEMAARIVLNKSQAATYWYSMGVPPELIGPLINMDRDAVEMWKSHMISAIGLLQRTQPRGSKSAPQPQTPAKGTEK